MFNPLIAASRSSRPRRRVRAQLLMLALIGSLLVAVAAPVTAGATSPATVAPSPFGAAKLSAEATARTAHGATVPVIVGLAQGATSLPTAVSQDPAAVATAQQVGTSLVASLPKGSSRATRTLSHLGLITTTVDAQGLAALQASPQVASIAVSQWRKPDLVPQETAIDAPSAWSAGTGFNGSGEAVAIIDTGVQPDHSFFGGRVIDGACFTSEGAVDAHSTATAICPGADPTTAPTTARDTPSTAGSSADSVPCTSVPNECFHGTHVAGIAAGGTGSTSGNGSGVAWGANIVAVQVFTTVTSTSSTGFCGAVGSCIVAADSDILAAIDWTLARRSVDHIVAANMSLGFGNSATACDSSANDAYHATFATAQADGVAPVVAAGNSYASTSAAGYPNGISFPACDSDAISVGAVTNAGQWVEPGTCDFVSLSPCSFSQDSPTLSMTAPGWNVVSSLAPHPADPEDGLAACSSNCFGALWGTSMATPFVTGAFAVIRQEHPTWTVSDILALLRGTGLPISDTRPGALGEATPMLNLGAAVTPPTFHAVTPGRLLDTRVSSGLPNLFPRLGAATTININVTGNYGVPSTGVSAVVLNITAVNPVGNGFVTAWPAGMPQPTTSNLNLTPGVVKPNLATVKVGANGKVSLFNQGGSVDLVVDIAGWYDAGGSAASGGTLHAVTPLRVLDTRDGTGIAGHVAAQLPAGSTLQLPVSTLGSLPVGATAVILNLTSVNVTTSGFVTAFPNGSSRPTASNLNPEPSVVSTNLAIVPIGSGGNVSLFNAGGPIDLVADLAGWYDNTSTPTTGHLVPLSPARLLDTRSAVGVPSVAPVGTNASINLQVTGRGGVPSSGVSAVIINLTAVNNTGNTFITAWPAGVGRPNASNLNPVFGRISSNLVTVPVSAGGQISLYNLNGSTDLIADVFGYYSG